MVSGGASAFPVAVQYAEDVDGRDIKQEDGAEPVIGPRFARFRWRLSAGHEEEDVDGRDKPGHDG
jgi:hypothetical protein